MTLSRTVTGLALAYSSVPAEAIVPVDYRLPPPRLDARAYRRDPCRSGGDEDDIVVCGRRDEDARFRVDPEPVPGARRRLIAGEPPGATLSDGGCYRSCPGSVGIAIDPILLLRDPVAALKQALHIRR